MTYVDAVRNALDRELPGIHPDLLNLYALLVLVRGEQVTREEVHDAWALWGESDHPWLVPYAELPDYEAEKDEPYVQAIKAVAVSLKIDVPRETSKEA